MSNRPGAHLFYGVVFTKEQAIAILKKDNPDLDEHEDDLYQLWEDLGRKLKCKAEIFSQEGFGSTYGFGTYLKWIYGWQDAPTKIKVPNETELAEKFKKVSQKLKLKCKPRWYLYGSYS